MAYDVVIFTDAIGGFLHLKPMGAYRIASELRAHGYTTKVVDLSYQIFKDRALSMRLLNKLIGDNTLFVGFSTTHMYKADVLKEDFKNDGRFSIEQGQKQYAYPLEEKSFDKLLGYYKNRFPQLRVVLGGVYATDSLLAPKTVDYMIDGYADVMVVELANHLRKGTPLKWRPSAVPHAKLIDYDKLGQSFDFAHSVTRYEEWDHIAPGETMCLETSRGCMFKCQFCDYPLLGRKKTDPTYVKYVDTLAAELRDNWERFGVKTYVIVDSTFNESTDKLLAVWEAIKQSGVDVKFKAFIRIDLLWKFPEQVEILRDMGLISAFFGIESLNAESLKSINKNYTLEKLQEFIPVLNAAWAGRVTTMASFIIGLPHETPETFNKWWGWLEQNPDCFDSLILHTLEIRNKNSWKSMFGTGPEQFGYELIDQLPGDVRIKLTWQNEHWTNLECENLTQSKRQWLHFNRRMTISNWLIVAFMSLGYTFEEMYRKPTLDWDWLELNRRLDAFKQDYIRRLCEYEGVEL
jgi:hypothetical protein